MAAAQRAGLDDHDVWLNGRIDKLGERGFRWVAAAHPGARMQCPRRRHPLTWAHLADRV